MTWIGTSGFQYPEWKGTFYPSKISTKAMLEYYAGQFSTTEINYTFHRIPSDSTLAGWMAATPAEFRFSLKAPKVITHINQLRNSAEVLERFAEAAVKLGPKLGVILFQLSPYFKKDVGLLNEFLGLLPRPLKCAFEFRHASWFDDATFETLRKAKKALCIADTADSHTPIVTTADYAYFRLRDEGYSESDIAEWAAKIAQETKRVRETYVYFKHEESGVGPKFAKQLKVALESL